MFNLGYKEVVLNNLDGVTGDGTGGGENIIIEGFGQLNAAPIASLAPSDPIAEIADWTTLPTVGDYVDVKIVMKKIRTDQRETIYFYAASPSATDIIGGYNVWQKNHPELEPKLSLAGSLTTKMLPGFESWNVTDVFIRPAYYNAVGNSTAEYRLLKAVTIEGSEGIGQGWQIEASRKLGTFVNSYPYGQQHGGNSIGVDLEAGYKEYNYSIAEAINIDWKSPEYAKHDFVNANMPTEDFNFVVYVHEDFVTDFEAL